MVNITLPNITIPQISPDVLNDTLRILNKTRQGPVTVPNAPAIPPWLENALLTIYLALLALSILLIAHYIYYARHSSRQPPDLRADPADAPLSIIIPVKNESPETVAQAVKRLAALNCPDAEIIVVSDDPPDAFEEIRKAVESLAVPNAKALRRPQPVGYKGVALNWAAERARGEILLFLDVDSVPPPDLCHRARAVGEREILFLGWDGYAPVKTPIATLQLFLYKYLLFHVAIVGRHNTGHPIFALGSGIAVRKKFLQEMGGFCNCTADDYDISMKAYLHGGRVVYSPGVPVYVEVPGGYAAFKKQYARWTYNSAYLLAAYGLKIFKLRMPLPHRISVFLNVATHPLMIMTTFAIMLSGLAMGYMGILLPPLHILILQLALGIAALAQVYYVYKLARGDGHSFVAVAGKLAKSAALLLVLSPYLALYVVLGALRRRIRWHITPKGLASVLSGRAGPYEIGLAAALGALFAYSLTTANPVFITNTAILLAAALYVLTKITSPPPRSDATQSGTG
ncbi:MAG: glycosyltransferase family 2 protein [Pyrobaculum sp.]